MSQGLIFALKLSRAALGAMISAFTGCLNLRWRSSSTEALTSRTSASRRWSVIWAAVPPCAIATSSAAAIIAADYALRLPSHLVRLRQLGDAGHVAQQAHGGVRLRRAEALGQPRLADQLLAVGAHGQEHV